MKEETKKEIIDWVEQARKQYIPAIIIYAIFVIITIYIYLQAVSSGDKLVKEAEKKKQNKQEQLNNK